MLLFFSPTQKQSKLEQHIHIYIPQWISMAVEARNLNLFPQIHCNRDMMNMNNEKEGAMNVYGTGMWYGAATPFSGTTTTAETLPPMYGSVITDSVPAAKNVAVKADSGLTYTLPVPVSRKRTREDNIDLLSFTALRKQNCNNNINNNHRCFAAGSFTFLGEDMSLQIQQQQLETDRLIAQHAEKVRMEIDERRKRFLSRIIAAVEQGIMKRLKSKEEEMEKMWKLNMALEERVKSLFLEIHLWRELAESNEATANALRNNLEQVLTQVHYDQQQRLKQKHGGDAADDAQSCCGSNYDDQIDGLYTPTTITDQKNFNGGGSDNDNNNSSSSSSRRLLLCRKCGKDEACVLVLPCRHLCLCTVCGSSLHTCPICKSTKNATLHVNMSF